MAAAEHNHDTLVAAYKKAIADEYRESLYKTAKRLLGYRDMTRRTHGATCEALESETKRKLIVMPRGTFKSSVAVVAYSIWALLRNPNERILIDSEIFSNSKNFIREIRSKLESPELTNLFGAFQTKNWNEGEITIAQRTKTFKEASITASGVGAQKTGQHYSIIIHDDLNSAKNSENPEQRKKVLDHYKLNISILEPDGVLILVGTRYAVDDVIGFALANEVDKTGFLS